MRTKNSALISRLRSSVRWSRSDIVPSGDRGGRRPTTLRSTFGTVTARPVSASLGRGRDVHRARRGGLRVRLGGGGGRRGRRGGRRRRGLPPVLRLGARLEVARRRVVPQALGLGLEDAGRTAHGAGSVRQLLVTEQRENDDRDDDQLWRTESEHCGPDLS